MNLWGIVKGILLLEENDKSKQLSVEIDPAATANTKTILKSAQTANRTVTLPDATDTLVGKATTDVLTNKSIDADTNTITNIENADIKVLAAIDATKIANGSVSNTEFQSLDGVTSNIQTQLDDNVADIAQVAADLASSTGNLQTQITDHINDPTGAHTASAITNVPSGNLVATDVQGALNEIQTEIDSIIATGGVTTASNVGTGTGKVFKQRTADDLEFKSIAAGANITVTNGTDDVTVAATGLANQSLSNLTSPTAINQDLTFDNTANRIVGISATASSPARNLILQAGNSTGTNITGGTLLLNAGASTGNTGSTAEVLVAPSGQASGVTARSAVSHTQFISNQSTNTLLLKAPINGGLDLRIQSSNNLFINPSDINSAGSSPSLIMLGAANTGTGPGGSVNLITATKTVAGISGSINLQTGSTTAGDTGAINLNIPIAVGGTRGDVEISARSLKLTGTPIVFSSTTVGITTTENQLGHSGNGIVTVTTTGASTINGIAAGIEGQLLIIRNSSANNLSFANEAGAATAADRITTQTGATITSAGISMHQLIYLAGRWQYLSGQL